VRASDLALSLGWYWITRATAEGVRWLDEVLATTGVASGERAWVYLVRGYLAVLQGAAGAASLTLERAVAAGRESGQLLVESSALSLAAIADNLAGDHVLAAGHLEEAKAAIGGENDLGARLTLLESRSLHGFFAGDLDVARSAAVEGVRLSRETGADTTLGQMLVNLGFADLMSDDLLEAKTMLEEALAVAIRVDDRISQYYGLAGLACVAARSRPARNAAPLLGASEAMRMATGARLNPVFARVVTEAQHELHSKLGKLRLESEMSAGKALSRESALAMALGQPVRTAPAQDRGLGKRQAEVAQLVAQGMTNKQIGARLFISEYTVDSHVRSILNTLGFSSRSQIAAWVGDDARREG
jgi:DNA-binding CsgD family transcriptional regulator